MYKVNITTLLPPKTRQQFVNIAKAKGITQRALFLDAFLNFKKELTTPNTYSNKHQDVDRLFDIITTIIIFEETLTEIDEVAEKLDISRRAATREIICEYFNTNKK